jgi:hypothetical protein
LLILVLSRPSSDGVTPLTVLAASFSTAALIHIAPKGRCISRFLSVPLMLYVGRISYSLYLWHWSVLVLFRWATPLKTADTLMALILSFGLAHASYRVVEQPLRTREWKRIGGSELPIGLGMIGAMSITLAASIVVTAQVKDDPWKGVRMVHAALKCHDPKWSQNPIKDCLFASDSDLPNLYVLGDSHAGNLIPSVRAAFPTTNVLYLTDAQLSTAMLQSGDTPSGYRRLSDTLSFIDSRLQNNDIVLVAFSRDTFSYLGEDTSNGQKDFAVGSPRLYDRIATRNLNFESALEVIAIHVKRVGARIVLFDGLPRLCSHAEFEIGKARSPQNPCSGDTEESLMDREGFSSMLRRVASNSGAEVIDAHQFLCPTPECHSTINGKLWTWDASPHFININDKVLAPFFRTIGKEWFEQ